MSETDTRDSLPSDTPSGQDPGGHTADTQSSSAAPDPHGVKAQGEGSAAEKDSAQWVTGDEPMTGPQASYLETLAHQAGETIPEGLSKARASDEIERLQSSGAGRSAPADGAPAVERPTDQWVTGEEPMTGPQASYLETLAQQAGTEAPKDLTKSQASRAIDDLQARAKG
jgi:hypothetical protein